MSYFPFFVDIAGKDCLVVGGGKVALRKIEKLLPFGGAMTVVAPEICEEIRDLAGLQLVERPFRKEDISGRAFVIGATNQENVNGEISALCMAAGIPVNIVDDREKCSFFFPALVKRGEFVAGFSTGGNSPLAAQYIRRQVEEILPNGFEEIIDLLGGLREECKRRIPKGETREAFWAAAFHESIAKDGKIGQAELEELLERFEDKDE